MKKQVNKEDVDIIYYYSEDVEKLDDHYLNKTSCLEPPVFADRECHLCDKVKKCIYERKYNYYKIS